MSVPSQSFYLINALIDIEYDCGKSIHMSDVFLPYY